MKSKDYERSNNKYYLKISTDKQQYESGKNPHFPISSLEIDWLINELTTWLALPANNNK